MAPSLFHRTSTGILSELYRGNGVNRFSWIQGEQQLLWEGSFAPPEPEYFRARLQMLGGEPSPPLSEPVEDVFRRLDARFQRIPPLTGGTPAPRLRLLRWRNPDRARTPDTPVERVEDRALARNLARSLRIFWHERFGPEVAPAERLQEEAGSRTPELSAEDEEALRSLGYIVGGNSGEPPSDE